MRRLRVAGFIASLPKLRIEPACMRKNSLHTSCNTLRARAPPKASQHQNVAHRGSWVMARQKRPSAAVAALQSPTPSQRHKTNTRPRIFGRAVAAHPPRAADPKKLAEPPIRGVYSRCVGRGHAVVALWPCPTGESPPWQPQTLPLSQPRKRRVRHWSDASSPTIWLPHRA